MKNTKYGILIGALVSTGKQLLTKEASQFDWNEVIDYSLVGGGIGLGIDVISSSSQNKNVTPICEISNNAQQLWEKATPIKNENPNSCRVDAYGNLISYCDYGNRNSIYGWEGDHIKPQSLGGSSEFSNMQPLQWYENVLKSNHYPYIPNKC